MSNSESQRLTADQRTAALALAERAVEHGTRHGELLEITRDIAEIFPDEERASFVSIYVADQLGGCVGRLRPTRTLEEDIVSNAFDAAFHDERFPPIEPEHLEFLDVRISVLDPLEAIPVETEDEVWEYVEPGRHGLLLTSDDHQGTFLPTVWEKCPDPDAFLAHLKEKAGLAQDAWPEDLTVFRYTVRTFDRETLADRHAHSDSPSRGGAR